jgi:hypothetical protein
VVPIALAAPMRGSVGVARRAESRKTVAGNSLNEDSANQDQGVDVLVQGMYENLRVQQARSRDHASIASVS